MLEAEPEAYGLRRSYGRGPRDDVIGILDHYDRISPALADGIADRIAAGPDPLLTQPGNGSPIERGSEPKWRTRQTPLISLYLVNDDVIEVRRVVDARSNWKRG